ncbi:MAG: hypothetical protein V4584_05725 [Verrucomicrobiota bacterium]
MKTILTTVTVTLLALLGTTPEAEARSRHSGRIYISSYDRCGTPVYSERYLIGYDHCGRPVWGTRLVRQACRPVYRPRPVTPCPPSYRGGRVVIQASFGR